MRRGERSPGIVGLDEFLTGWMTDREWMADRSMTLIYLDSGRFGQMLSVEPRRKHLFHESVAPMLAGRLYLDLCDATQTEVPAALTRGFERGVRRFLSAKTEFSEVKIAIFFNSERIISMAYITLSYRYI